MARLKSKLTRAWRTAWRRILCAWVRTRVLPADAQRQALGEATVCYVLEVHSWSNFLVLEDEMVRRNLPSPAAVIPTPESETHGPYASIAMRRRRGRLRRRETHGDHLAPLDAVLDRAREGADIKLLPVSIFWGRRPQRSDSIFKTLFSDTWALMGPIRKFFTIVLHGRQVLMRVSPPISLSEYVSENQREDIALRKLSRVLRVHFRRQRTATIGPDLSHRRTMVHRIVSSRLVRDTIEREAAKNGAPRGKLERRAERYALEIVADYSYPVVRLMDHLLTWVWNRLYDGVVLHNFDTVREAAPGHELVYVPCHRSHMDYLLLSYALYYQGLVPPHVAAGINLNIPVIGGLLRRGGAFYIRRTFKGNRLYAAVLNEYLALNFAKGVSIEYFIEGMRSRTGRLVKPRVGLLSMSARAYLRHRERPVVFVPVHISYEKVIELPSYVNELSGRPKRSESIAGFVKSLGALWRRWGKVHINVGEPLSLEKWFDDYCPAWRDQSYGPHARPAWLSPAVKGLATELNTRINRAAAINPTHLVSTALLAHPKHALGEHELIELIDLLRELIRTSPDNDRVTVTDMESEEMIRYTERLRVIQRQPHELGDVFYLDARDSVLLTYYRNNCLHLFALPSLIACCFNHREAFAEDALYPICRRTYPLLHAQLYLPWEIPLPRSVFDRFIHALAACGLVRVADGEIRKPDDDRHVEQLQTLAHPMKHMVQRFYLCVSVLTQHESASLTRDELEQLAGLAAQRLSLLHDFQTTDLFSDRQVSRFIAVLKSRGWVWTEDDRLAYDDTLLNLRDDARIVLSPAVRERIARTVG